MNKLMREFENVLEMIHNVDMGNIFRVDMSKSEFIIMKVIYSIKESSEKKVLVSDIVDKMHVSAQAISKTLKSLEKKGYIERFSNKEDRRRMEVAVTEKGGQTYFHLIRKTDEVLSEVLGKFGKEELETYISLTRRLTGLYGEVIANIKQ